MNCITVQQNVPLKGYTTFKIGGNAKFFTVAKSVETITEASNYAEANNLPIFLLGSGSNVLISDSGFPGLVIKVEMTGHKVVREDDNQVIVRVAAGDIWDDFVEFSVQSGWWGIENMSYIPGTVGAIPIQNAGAYGQEACDAVVQVEVFDRKTKTIKQLSNQECRFSYRESIFNTIEKKGFVILSVTFRLNKKGKPNFSLNPVKEYFYPTVPGRNAQIKKILEVLIPNKKTPDLKDMRDCIIYLRKDGRLPDPDKLGNAGSFFKSLVLSETEYQNLENNVKKNLPEENLIKIREFKHRFSSENGIKIPIAFLINACGLESSKSGGAGLYEKNSAIIVNFNCQARSRDVMTLAKKVRQIVHQKTGVIVPIEPVFVGFTKKELDFYLSL